ncbi:hypothetical protein FA13DRAFT_1719035 [Coprinellus micaceus]|uniref:Uncharacterized protein n=1 Tax=Coprinellus micaceus TaxID=71717 RepID=A0A4Y7SC87_COPMI|nr:hypothetical protein FA13DRAFT_1719035 [Coprinellus micaceus]
MPYGIASQALGNGKLPETPLNLRWSWESRPQPYIGLDDICCNINANERLAYDRRARRNDAPIALVQYPVVLVWENDETARDTTSRREAGAIILASVDNELRSGPFVHEVKWAKPVVLGQGDHPRGKHLISTNFSFSFFVLSQGLRTSLVKINNLRQHPPHLWLNLGSQPGTLSCEESAGREDLTSEFGVFSIGGLYHLEDSKVNPGNGLGSTWSPVRGARENRLTKNRPNGFVTPQSPMVIINDLSVVGIIQLEDGRDKIATESNDQSQEQRTITYPITTCKRLKVGTISETCADTAGAAWQYLGVEPELWVSLDPAQAFFEVPNDKDAIRRCERGLREEQAIVGYSLDPGNYFGMSQGDWSRKLLVPLWIHSRFGSREEEEGVFFGELHSFNVHTLCESEAHVFVEVIDHDLRPWKNETQGGKVSVLIWVTITPGNSLPVALVTVFVEFEPRNLGTALINRDNAIGQPGYGVP